SSRTLTVSVSAHTKLYGPASSGRSRNIVTWAPKWAAISLTATATTTGRQLLSQPLHSPGGHSQQVGSRDHGDQGLLGPATMGEQPVRKVRADPVTWPGSRP